ncbi:hypothetical protein CXR34_08745 [Microbacterium hominis]|uniref:Uncharacterized protein n=2 Tax=Microbacterium hominis TaxID=162426 RepID=A0A2K9DUU3_9MICO|nr:hypothetical protein CXR34_08745 [Microbacterium hominis]
MRMQEEVVVVAPSNAAPTGRRRRRLALSIKNRRSTAIAIGAAALLLLISAAALVVPRFASPQALPDTAAIAGVGPISEAQQRFRDEFGRFAPSMSELETKGTLPFIPPPNLWFTTGASSDGESYFGAVRNSNDEFAVIIVTASTRDQGAGGSLNDAIDAAGWSADKLHAAGLDARILRTTEHGAKTVDGDRILTLTTSPENATSIASIVPVPRSGTGDTWQEAVTEAGGDPAGWRVDFTPDDTPRTIKASDGAVLTLARGSHGVDARIDPPTKSSRPSTRPETAASELGITSKLGALNGSFRCATAISANGVHSATLCEDSAGTVLIFATTGHAAVGSQGAFASIGADALWTSRTGVTLPTTDDLF